MGEIQNSIKKYGQISSRIARVVEFLPATLEDVQSACKQLAEVEMSPELTAEIHRLSRGCMREVLNMLPVVERVAKTNRLVCVGLIPTVCQTAGRTCSDVGTGIHNTKVEGIKEGRGNIPQPYAYSVPYCDEGRDGVCRIAR